MQAAAEQREMAALGVLAMLAGFVASGALQWSEKRPLFSSAVMVLSLANGVVGLLQYCSSPGWFKVLGVLGFRLKP